MWKRMDSYVRTPAVEGPGKFLLASGTRLLASRALPLPTCSLFAVPAATCHQSASPQCAARTPAAAPHPLAAIVAPKRKGRCPKRGRDTMGGARTPVRLGKGWGI